MFCIPKNKIAEVKKAMQEVGGKELVSMSVEQLTDVFSVPLGKELGADTAKSFHKATMSHKRDAMVTWAKKTLTAEEAKNVEKHVDELVDDVYEGMDGDVIERAIGVGLTPEEVDKINGYVKDVFDASQLEADNIYSGYHSDYFKAKDTLHKYLDTVNEMSTLDVLTKIVFRGTLLFAPKSIITNIVGNTAGGLSEKIIDVAINRKVSGVNSDLIKGYIQYALKTYSQSGIDVVRAMDAGGAHTVLGEHFKGAGRSPGVIRAYGRWMEQYVFKLGQGTPDIAFAAMHFADHVNVLSTKMADAKGLTGDALKEEARRLFLSATSLNLDVNDPNVADAVLIKREALQYALTATYQNDTAWSKNVLAIRGAIDDYTGVLNLGTNLDPFVKTLVNVAKLSIDMTGTTLPFEIPRLVVAYKQGDAETMRKTIRVIVRAGFGMALAYLLSGLLDDNDYIPDYIIASAYQKQLATTANASYNSIRIGDKWVSLAYFGTFGYALAGMLGARQKNTAVDATFSYYKNVVLQMRQTPVLGTVFDIYDYYDEASTYNKTGGDLLSDAVSNTSDFFAARTVPAIVSDIAKVADTYERKTPYGMEGIAARFEARIPLWREILPIKYNAFGDPIETEAFYWVLLSGSRMKTAPDDTSLYNELSRLAVGGEEVSLKFSARQEMKIAKTMLTPNEYYELESGLGREMKNAFANTVATQKYRNETDPEKQKALLMDQRDKILDKVLREFGYRTRIKEELRRIKREKK